MWGLAGMLDDPAQRAVRRGRSPSSLPREPRRPEDHVLLAPTLRSVSCPGDQQPVLVGDADAAVGTHVRCERAADELRDLVLADGVDGVT